MPLFKSRSAKIEPFNGPTDLENVYAENTQPKLDLFSKVPACETLSSGNPKRVVLTERMDDPEEVCELSPLSLYYSGSGKNLNIPTSLSAGEGSFFRRSMDFCQSDFPPPPNFHPTRKNDVARESPNELSDSSSHFQDNFPIWRKQEDNISIDRTACKGSRWLLKDIDKTAKLKYKFRNSLNTTKLNDAHSWTVSPDLFYNYISKIRNSSRELEANTVALDDRVKHSLFSEGNRLHVTFSPDVLVVNCVLNNLKEDLKLVLRYSKIDVNFYSQSGDFSPLHLAAQLGYSDCVQVLLHYGANVNHLDGSGHSPLYKAFSGLHFECAVLLIEAGADIRQFTAQKLKEIRQLKSKTEFYKHELETD